MGTVCSNPFRFHALSSSKLAANAGPKQGPGLPSRLHPMSTRCPDTRLCILFICCACMYAACMHTCECACARAPPCCAPSTGLCCFANLRTVKHSTSEGFRMEPGHTFHAAWCAPVDPSPVREPGTTPAVPCRSHPYLTLPHPYGEETAYRLSFPLTERFQLINPTPQAMHPGPPRTLGPLWWLPFVVPSRGFWKV